MLTRFAETVRARHRAVNPVRIGLIAGEASGDLLAAGLIEAIRVRRPDATFEGVAGPAMLAAGCERLAAADELAVMGFVEPLKRLLPLLRLRRGLVGHWRRDPPDVFVGVDAPDFNLSVEKRLRAAGIPTVHYVSPTVWAWRRGRLRTIRQAAGRVLCLFPFEERFLIERGVNAVFVGHPKAHELAGHYDPAAIRRQLGLPASGCYVAVLPGSRRSEVGLLAAAFAGAAALLAAQDDLVRFLVPLAAPHLEAPVRRALAQAGVASCTTLYHGSSLNVMRAADVILQASGTATLEAALLGKPAVAAYRAAPLTAWLIRTFGLLKVDFITMPNLLLGERVIPEFVQEAATAENLAAAVRELLADPERRRSIRARFETLRKALAVDSDSRAADAVLAMSARR